MLDESTGWSTTAVHGLHEAVARVAAQAPDHVALRAGERAASYGELDALVDRWAVDLAAAGVGPGTLIPILLPRSLELVVSLLAVLRTGAAFALLDPRWPRPHLQAVVDDLDGPVLIDSTADRAELGPAVWIPPNLRPAYEGGEAVATVAPLPSIASLPTEPVAPDAACCVFFTSGTTGRPKGVVVPHRAISRLFSDDTFARFDHRTVTALSAATPWDAFALELWGGLFRGGTCVVVEEPFLTPDVLRRVVADDGVNIVWLTSSLFNMIVDEDLDAFAGLGQVLVGGERLSVSHVQRFTARHPGIVLTNGYGPVESTIFASTHQVMPMDHLHPGGIPLGLCVSATSVYVLDGDRECGRDELGEICVSGDGLAIGYLGDPELTAQRFATVSIGGRPTRVYRTGDLGVWGSPDGLLEFRGRADRQVKVRGHRVEPAQIEQAIVHLSPPMAACRVIPRPTARGDASELVAFCVPRFAGDTLPGLAELVAAHLPQYQCPSQYVVVDQFPLNDRGKVNEARLIELSRAIGEGAAPPPDGPSSPSSSPLSPSLSPGEPAALVDVVAGAFAEVLGRSAVPPDAGFFELGGSSLDAGRVCARLRQRTGVPVALSQFYRHRTAAALARWLAAEPGPSEADLPAPAGDLPLRPVQIAFLLRDVVEPDRRTNHCLIAWQLTGQVDIQALDRAVVCVHERQEALRAEYALEPYPHARVVDVDAPDLRVLPPQPSVAAALERLRAELSQPLEPDVGRVWRTALVLVSPGDVSVLGCSVHHVAFDGWSEAVLADELSLAYSGVAGAAPPSLASLSRQWQDRISRADVAGQVSALADALRGTPAIRWPTEGFPSEAASGIGVESGELSADAYAAAASLAAATGTTPFAVLLTAWAGALHDVLGIDDVAVGVPVADRVSADADGEGDRAIGCQLATVPVRLRGASTRAARGASFVDGVAETARAVDLSMACQDAPLADLVDALGPVERGRTPVFQTMFALQDNLPPQLRLAGVSATQLPLPYLDLPTELHCEIWPAGSGRWRVDVTYRRDSVPPGTARRLLRAFLALATSGPGAPVEQRGADRPT